MKKYFTVKEVAALMGYKNEETIKRKIKDGIFPNAFQNSRKEGWRIPASDVAPLTSSSLTKVQDRKKSLYLGIGCLDQGSITDTKTNKVKTSYMFRVIPKGRDEPAVFYVNKDTFDLIKEIAIYLKDVHYKGSIPKVDFNYRKRTGESRPDQPYLYQLHGKHFGDNTFACILNFICFGLIYEMQDKKLVKLKPH
jgi:hypothetical protein